MGGEPQAMKMLPAAPGTCCMCATKHGEHDPHNYWSTFYQTRFKLKYGRDATQADATAHLDLDRLRAYVKALCERGIDVTVPPVDQRAIAEPYAESHPFGKERMN